MCIPLGISAYSCADQAKAATQKGDVKEAERLTRSYQTFMYTMSGIIEVTGVVLGPLTGFATYKSLK